MPDSARTAVGDKKPGNIFLIGPMGVGKSTIGRQLARRLELEFHDSDQTIEARTGVDIPLIFDIEGEDGFRRREQQVIDELTAMPGIVLATGGGAILNAANRHCLKERGYVVYLRADAEQLLARTDRDTQRPLLEADDRLSRIKQILGQREPLYQDLADLIIETDSLTVRRTVNNICRHLQTS